MLSALGCSVLRTGTGIVALYTRDVQPSESFVNAASIRLTSTRLASFAAKNSPVRLNLRVFEFSLAGLIVIATMTTSGGLTKALTYKGNGKITHLCCIRQPVGIGSFRVM
ncbi:hypothetical protein DVQ85_11155 [Yersinia enterocolitica]|nr:hypothetical protein [Yersinia enterocolitica]EKN5989872.1 hypothetical protein [Yersinia enterocolitica]